MSEIHDPSLFGFTCITCGHEGFVHSIEDVDSDIIATNCPQCGANILAYSTALSQDERIAKMKVYTEHLLEYEERLAYAAGDAERRTVAEIGYGTLFDDDAEQIYEYTLLCELGFSDRVDSNSLDQLRDMVEQAVKQWLTNIAPTGTRTGLVIVDEEYPAS